MTNARDLQIIHFNKAAKKIGCSDVTNMQRCFDHATRMATNGQLDDTTTMRVMTVLEVSALLK